MISKKNFLYLGLFSAFSIAAQDLQANDKPTLPSFSDFSFGVTASIIPQKAKSFQDIRDQRREDFCPSSIRLKTPFSSILPPPPPPYQQPQYQQPQYQQPQYQQPQYQQPQYQQPQYQQPQYQQPQYQQPQYQQPQYQQPQYQQPQYQQPQYQQPQYQQPQYQQPQYQQPQYQQPQYQQPQYQQPQYQGISSIQYVNIVNINNSESSPIKKTQRINKSKKMDEMQKNKQKPINFIINNSNDFGKPANTLFPQYAQQVQVIFDKGINSVTKEELLLLGQYYSKGAAFKNFKCDENLFTTIYKGFGIKASPFRKKSHLLFN